MRIAITGGSGLVGSRLVSRLRAGGHEVRRLVRREPGAADEIAWDPAAQSLDSARFTGTDAVINLAGENVGAGRWTTARRNRILQSRIDATRTLVGAMETMERRPRVLLNASAIGYYGDRGDEVLTESSAPGRGFLSQVCGEWEGQAQRATPLGVRVVLMRFGMILAREGGALARMLPLFRLGLGGRMGSGQQWMSWIGIDDVVGTVEQALEDGRLAGPMNVTAPAAVTNAEFAFVLGRALGRPAILPVPSWALRIAFGQAMANEAMLVSQRAAPRRLSEFGYVFRHATLEGALRATV